MRFAGAVHAKRKTATAALAEGREPKRGLEADGGGGLVAAPLPLTGRTIH